MMLLESKSVTDMLAIVDSYNWIIEYNTAEIQSAIKMENELKSAKQQLETNKADVDKAPKMPCRRYRRLARRVNVLRHVQLPRRLRSSRRIRMSSIPRLRAPRRSRPQVRQTARLPLRVLPMSGGHPTSPSS